MKQKVFNCEQRTYLTGFIFVHFFFLRKIFPTVQIIVETGDPNKEETIGHKIRLLLRIVRGLKITPLAHPPR